MGLNLQEERPVTRGLAVFVRMVGWRRPRRNRGGGIRRTRQLMEWELPESRRPYNLWVYNLGGSLLSGKTGKSPSTGLSRTTVVLQIVSSGMKGMLLMLLIKGTAFLITKKNLCL